MNLIKSLLVFHLVFVSSIPFAFSHQAIVAVETASAPQSSALTPEQKEYRTRLVEFASAAVSNVARNLYRANLVGAARGLQDKQDRANRKAEIDSYAEKTIVNSVNQYNVTVSIYTNEGKGDGVPGTLTPYDIEVPISLIGERDHIRQADSRGDLFYTSSNYSRNVIAPVILDAVEGTDATADNSVGEVIGKGAQTGSGGSSIIAVGEPVHQLGKMPELYALQFFANFGRYAEEFKELTTTTAKGTYHWYDPELYAQEPERIRDVLRFAQERSSKSKEDFTARVTVMKRHTETALIDALKNAREEEFPGLQIDLIKAGSVAPGLKSVLDPEGHRLITGKDNDVDFEMMLTRGGGAEARWNLVVAYQLASTGAIGAVRDASLDNMPKIPDDENGDQRRRYDFSEEEQSDIIRFRGEEQGDCIIKGAYLHTADGLEGMAVSAFASITFSGILNLPAADKDSVPLIVISNDDAATPVINKLLWREDGS